MKGKSYLLSIFALGISHLASAGTVPGVSKLTVDNHVAVNSEFDIAFNTVSGATSYKLYENGSLLTHRTSSPIVRKLRSSGVRTYYIEACNASGCGNASNTVTVDAGYPVTTKVSLDIADLTVPPYVNFNIDINESVSNATFYNLYENGLHLSQRTDLPIARYPDFIGSRSYAIEACNNYGCGPKSNSKTVKINHPIKTQATILIEENKVPVNDYFPIGLASLIAGATYYEVYENGSKLTTKSGTSFPFDRYSGSRAERQTYQIKACNDYGCGPLSNGFSVDVGVPVKVEPLLTIANQEVPENVYFDISLSNNGSYNADDIVYLYEDDSSNYQKGRYLAARKVSDFPIKRYPNSRGIRYYRLQVCNDFGCQISEPVKANVVPNTDTGITFTDGVQNNRAVAFYGGKLKIDALDPQGVEKITLSIDGGAPMDLAKSNGMWEKGLSLGPGNYSIKVEATDSTGKITVRELTNTFNICSDNGRTGTLTPEEFGAYGDGMSDDFDAFAAMLQCSSGLAQNDGSNITGFDTTDSVIVLPAKTYCINDTLDTGELFSSRNRSIHIKGQGTDDTTLKQCELPPQDNADFVVSMFKADYNSTKQIFRIEKLSAQGVFWLPDNENDTDGINDALFHKWLRLPFSEAWAKREDCSAYECKQKFDPAFVQTISTGNVIAQNIDTKGFVYGFNLISPRGIYINNIKNNSFLSKLLDDEENNVENYIIERSERSFGAPFNKLFSNKYACEKGLRELRENAPNPCPVDEGHPDYDPEHDPNAKFNGEQNGGNWNAAVKVDDAREHVDYERIIKNITTKNSGAAVLLGASSQDVNVSSIECTNIHDNCVYVSSGINVRVNAVNGTNIGGAVVKGRGNNIHVHGVTGGNATVGVTIQSLRPGASVTSTDITGVKLTDIRSDGIRIQHYNDSGDDIIKGVNICDIDISFSRTSNNNYNETDLKYSYSGIWVGSDMDTGKVSDVKVASCASVYGDNITPKHYEIPETFEKDNLTERNFPLFDGNVTINKGNATQDYGIVFLKNMLLDSIELSVEGHFPNSKAEDLSKWINLGEKEDSFCSEDEGARFNCIVD